MISTTQWNVWTLFSLKKEGNLVICYNMDELWTLYAKWNKPHKKPKSVTICKTDSQTLLYEAGNPKLMLCDNLEGWGGEGGGNKVQEGGDICIPLADSCWSMAETITTLQLPSN